MFLYIFDKDICNILVKYDFTLLKSDDKNNTYVFDHGEIFEEFLAEHMSIFPERRVFHYVISDVLTF